MYVPSKRYDAVAAFVMGYDIACEGGVLAGFREWLVIRLGSAFSNLWWPALVLHVAFPSDQIAERALTTETANRKAIDVLFSLIAEFDVERSAHGGLARILVKYESLTARRSPKRRRARQPKRARATRVT
jgi:hypothetical protein